MWDAPQPRCGCAWDVHAKGSNPPWVIGGLVHGTVSSAGLGEGNAPGWFLRGTRARSITNQGSWSVKSVAAARGWPARPIQIRSTPTRKPPSTRPRSASPGHLSHTHHMQTYAATHMRGPKPAPRAAPRGCGWWELARGYPRVAPTGPPQEKRKAPSYPIATPSQHHRSIGQRRKLDVGVELVIAA